MQFLCSIWRILHLPEYSYTGTAHGARNNDQVWDDELLYRYCIQYCRYHLTWRNDPTYIGRNCTLYFTWWLPTLSWRPTLHPRDEVGTCQIPLRRVDLLPLPPPVASCLPPPLLHHLHLLLPCPLAARWQRSSDWAVWPWKVCNDHLILQFKWDPVLHFSVTLSEILMYAS